MTDSGSTLERDVIATIRGFLSERREWELRTMERVTGWRRGDDVDPDRPVKMDFEELERATAELAAIRASWCTADAVARLDPKASFGSSPDFDPEGVSIAGLTNASDASVVVRTRESPVLPTEYEYRLRPFGPGWRIDQRAMVEQGRDRIDDLL